MSKINAQEIYLEFKRRARTSAGIYKEKIHCPLIIEVMHKNGTMTAFCKQAMISDGLFSKWVRKYPLFSECYNYGKILSRDAWEEEGRMHEDDPEFDWDEWRHRGAIRYGYGRGRVKLAIDKDADPYQQYQQVLEQANREEFTAGELRQIADFMKVGSMAHENYKLQQAIDDMQKDLDIMRSHTDEQYKGSAKTAKKKD